MGKMNRYEMYLKIKGRWRRVCTIEAENHALAFRKAMTCMKPEHYDKPLRLEQETPPSPPSERSKPKPRTPKGLRPRRRE